MGRLIVVRHGQASFFGPDYDRLSSTGAAQAFALGEYLVRRGERPDRVLAGPLRRHGETAAATAEGVAKAGGAWPAPQTDPALDEHQVLAVLRHALGPQREVLPRRAPEDESERRQLMRAYFREYRAIVRRWSEGAYADAGVETWAAARHRAATLLTRLTDPAHDGTVTLAITSGGILSMVVGALLGIDDARVVDLGMEVRNSALTEIAFRRGRARLTLFNATPHLDDSALESRI